MTRLLLGVGLLLLTGRAGAESEPSQAPADKESREQGPAEKTVGWLESIILDGKVQLTAKLDTGAEVAALDAEDPVFFEKDGARWVRFNVRRHGHGVGPPTEFTAAVTGEKKIRPSSGEIFTRPTIELMVCVGGEQRRVEFTLGDRAKMSYRLLLGRDALAGHLLVDSGRKFTTRPGCELPATKESR